MTGKRSFYFSLYYNYHVIEYSYELTNFYQMLKSTVETAFEPKKKETSATTKTSTQFKIISGVVVVVTATSLCKNAYHRYLTAYSRFMSLYHS